MPQDDPATHGEQNNYTNLVVENNNTSPIDNNELLEVDLIETTLHDLKMKDANCISTPFNDPAQLKTPLIPQEERLTTNQPPSTGLTKETPVDLTGNSLDFGTTSTFAPKRKRRGNHKS